MASFHSDGQVPSVKDRVKTFGRCMENSFQNSFYFLGGIWSEATDFVIFKLSVCFITSAGKKSTVLSVSIRSSAIISSEFGISRFPVVNIEQKYSFSRRLIPVESVCTVGLHDCIIEDLLQTSIFFMKPH